MSSSHRRGKVYVPGKAEQKSVDEQMIMGMAADSQCFILRGQA